MLKKKSDSQNLFGIYILCISISSISFFHLEISGVKINLEQVILFVRS